MPREGHFINRSGWLRASVLGANDGILSTASLLVGVLSAGMDRSGVLLTGFAGISAGAFSMAAGEYVSVSAQADIETADLERERRALDDDPEYELAELTEGLEARGVSADVAAQAAQEMTEHDALDAHAREELGLSELTTSNPMQAAFASAGAFAAGAALPLVAATAMTGTGAIPLTVIVTLITLATLGVVAARMGGAPAWPAVRRVVSWGVIALAMTSLVGHLFGAAV